MTAPREEAVDADDGAGQSPPVISGLLAKLVAEVRPEFRDEVLVFDPSDPVFGGAICRVTSCGRLSNGGGLCGGHRRRWAAQGRPDLNDFTVAGSPPWKGQQYPPCRVPGCRYGGATEDLCHDHSGAWKRAGRPSLRAWVAAQPAVAPDHPPQVCGVSHCDLWLHAELPLCFLHEQRWKRYQRRGATDIGEFIRGCDTDRLDRAACVDLRCLQSHMRLELQYVLQCRRDETRAKIKPRTASTLARFLARAEAHSLLDRSEPQWVEHSTRSGVAGLAGKSERGLLIYARRKVEDLAYGLGWDVEYPRDVWRLHSLGVAGPHAHLRFDRIPQPWLRSLAKRWSRLRLSSGISSTHVYCAVAAITRFGAFLTSPPGGVNQLADIDRAVLERYLGDLHTQLAGSYDHGGNIGHLNMFFQAIRRNGWDEGAMPATAVFFTEDYPKLPRQLPRSLADQVMAQVENPANLDQWAAPNGRLLTVILIRCGLRIGDGATLAFNCVVLDGDGAPYVRYYNHKMKREALVPIDEELHQMIKDHQRQLLQRWPDGIPVLFPRRIANLDGNRPIGSNTYREALHKWLERCDIRDSHGLPIHLTPHQWRHTLVISPAKTM